MKNLKQFSLLAGFAALFCSSDVLASGKPTDINAQEEKKSPPIAQKAGKEAARVVGQAEQAKEKIKSGWKKQRSKDKKKKKEIKDN